MKNNNKSNSPENDRNSAKTGGAKEAHIEVLRQKGKKLSSIWVQMMEQSEDRQADNERAAKAYDDFFVASYWIDQGDYDTAIAYMEEAVKSLNSLINRGVTKDQHLPPI